MTWLDKFGVPVSNAGPWERPVAHQITGRYAQLVPLDLSTQADELWEEMNRADPTQEQWAYLAGMGPFDSKQAWVETWQAWSVSNQNETFAVRDLTDNRLKGQFSLLRIRPEQGSAEVGFVRFPPQMQRTRCSTEAQFLLMNYILDELGYRRWEWKCDSRNAPSMTTAARLGFTYEGTFRNDLVVRGVNRDTAWWSIIDSEWPAIKAGYRRWLDPSNFDDNGRQKVRLSACLMESLDG